MESEVEHKNKTEDRNETNYNLGNGTSELEVKSRHALTSENSGTEGMDSYSVIGGSKSSFDLTSAPSGRDSKASFESLYRKDRKPIYKLVHGHSAEPQEVQGGLDPYEDSIKEGFGSSRGGGDGLSSQNSREDLDKVSSAFSPLSSRDTIAPPDLFNTNSRMACTETQVARPETRLDTWSTEKTYTSQTLSRRQSKSHSHNRSKRTRNRSLEMVLDETPADSPASKSDYARSRQFYKSLERPKPRRADRYMKFFI